MKSIATPDESGASVDPDADEGSIPAMVRSGPRGWVLRYRRLLIVGLHLALIPLGYFTAYLLRFEGAVPEPQMARFVATVPALVVIRMAIFGFHRLFSGWWRHVGMHDLSVLLRAVTLSSGVFLGFLFLTGELVGFSRSVLVLDWLLAMLLFGGMRFGVRWLREGGVRSAWAPDGRRILIIGAGDGAAHLLRQIRLDPESDLHPVGLLDDDAMKHHIHIHGVPVLGATSDLRRLVTERRVEMVVIAIPSAGRETMQRIAEHCTGVDIEFKIVPSVRELVDGQARLSQLRTVQIEDLLGRPPVSFEMERVDRDLAGKVVLISGGAGSIGSELARQVALTGPARLVLVDKAESGLYFMQHELLQAHPGLDLVPVIADVANEDRMERVFERFQPEYVFHAAAYKHVPLMERNVEEAVRNNVLGTRRLARAAVRHGVGKFVMISTDKAVNPSSVMGVTKRIAERLLLGCPEFTSASTDFRAVRFGNVLGSDGSVIPLFKRQIAAGGPVTVTHPDMERFFMTIAEAVQLVLQAAALPEAAGRISMLEMGQPVRIVDLAENLIRLSGLKPYTEMPIVFTGLRPGEKLSEELSTALEKTFPTPVEKVRIVQLEETDGPEVQRRLEHLEWGLAEGDLRAMLRSIRMLVPECVSPLRDRDDLPLRLESRRSAPTTSATA